MILRFSVDVEFITGPRTIRNFRKLFQKWRVLYFPDSRCREEIDGYGNFLRVVWWRFDIVLKWRSRITSAAKTA